MFFQSIVILWLLVILVKLFTIQGYLEKMYVELLKGLKES